MEGPVPERYVIAEQLGAGGFGRVYRATDPTGRIVALKIVRTPRTRTSGEGLLRLQSEIELLRAARCPQVVQIFDYGPLGDDSFFIAMELVRGRTLREHLGDGPLGVPQALALAAEVADAVSRLHDMNILHRDLKPENILVEDLFRPSVKLVDFGVSLLQVAGTRRPGAPATIAGTLGYMAPECFALGGAPVDAASDLWSIGVILYEMLVGFRPYEGATVAEFLSQVVSRMPDPPTRFARQAPFAVDAVAAALLSRDPERRYQSAASLRDDLRRLKAQLLDGREGEPFELALADAGRARLAHTPLFGRARELAALEERLDRVARTRRGEAALLVGAAGMGKSRLLAELSRGVEARPGMLWATGRCRHDIDLIPYAPLREAIGELARSAPLRGIDMAQLRARFGEVNAAQWRVLCAMAPELGALLPGAAGEEVKAAQAGDDALLADAVVRLCRAIAESTDGGVVAMVFEDLQWSEASTRAVVTQLLARLDGAPLLLIGSFRGDEVTVEGLIGERAAAALPPGTLVPVEPLRPDDNRQMLSHLVGDPLVAAQLVQKVGLLGRGVPLFNMELLKLLFGEGRIRRSAHAGGTRVALADFDVPDSISRVLLRTVDGMGEQERAILSLAALLGRSFIFEELEVQERFQPLDIVRALDAAVAADVCRPTAEGYLFAHESIRQAFIERLSDDEQRELHAAIAVAFSGDRGRGPGYLAHHLERGGQPVAAARRYVESAEEAAAAHDPSRARAHLERALKLLASPTDGAIDPSLRALYVEVAARLVAVGAELGQIGPLHQTLERCEALIADGPEVPPEAVAALHSAFAKLHHLAGDSAKAEVYSQLALDAGESHRLAPELQTIPTNLIGRNLCAYGRFAEAVGYLELGAHLLDERGDLAERSHTLAVLSGAYGHLGQLGLAERSAKQARELAEALGDPVRRIAAHAHTAALAELRGDWRAGLEEVSALFRLCEASGLGGNYFYLGSIVAGRVHYFLGHFDRARYLLDNAITLAGRLGVRVSLPPAHAYLADVLAATGRWEEARASFDRALALATDTGDLLGEALAHVGLARIRGRVDGDLAGAQAHLKVALRVLRRGGSNVVLLRALRGLGPLLTQLGDGEAGRRAQAEAEALARAIGVALEHADPIDNAALVAPPARVVYEALWASTRLMQTMASDAPPFDDDGKLR